MYNSKISIQNQKTLHWTCFDDSSVILIMINGNVPSFKELLSISKKLIQLMHFFFRFNLLQNYCKACKMRIFRSCNLSRITESSKLSNALSTRACSYYKGGFIYTFKFKFSSSFGFCLSDLGSGSLAIIHTNMDARLVIFWLQLCCTPHY